ncbi:MAG: tetratricopeptide repeat-containing diguanylate cyclase, partial [Bacillota bacterium]|nr:tetratricopeptide repeat-containing diguanylate cyclase [Bacillota bacterium]
SKILSEEAYNMSKSNGLELEEGYSLISMAFAARAKSEIKEMLDLSFKALNIFDRENEIIGKIKAMNLIGIAYFYSSMYEESLKYLLEVSELLNIEKDDFLLSCVLNNIGEVYRESQKYEQALKYYNKAADISKENSYEKIYASILGNIGEVYFSKKSFEKSLEILKESYEILVNCNDMVSLGENENRIGKLYFNIGDYSKAHEFYNSSLIRLQNIENKYYLIDAYINIAKLKEISNPEEALHYFKKALDTSENINAKKKSCEIYKMISEIYEILGDYKSSLEYNKKHSNTDKEIMASNLGNKLEILNIEIENTKEKNNYREIKKRLEQEIEYQRIEIEKIKKTNETLFHKAYEDELTGIPNRRSINSYLKRILIDETNEDENIGVLMIDIDHFKRYNDYWGHAQGDLCLKKIAATINEVQESDNYIFGRYGGEEFVYVLRDTDYIKIKEIGNKIREVVEKLNIHYIFEEQKQLLTVSVGGAYGKITKLNKFSNLMELADKELYKAKDKGRNTTIINNLCN